jgi:TorA maturation chaperone TorD
MERMSTQAQLLAHWWSQPTAEERGWWEGAWMAAEEAFDPELVDELRSAAESADEAELLEEYERLLVGPGRTPCPPYESLWREGQPRLEQGRLMATAAAEAQEIYRELGLSVRGAAHELPDHVAIEWEALAYAVESGSDEQAEQLAHDHLGRWMPAFCASVAAETSVPFYETLTRLTLAATAALAA